MLACVGLLPMMLQLMSQFYIKSNFYHMYSRFYLIRYKTTFNEHFHFLIVNVLKSEKCITRWNIISPKIVYEFIVWHVLKFCFVSECRFGGESYELEQTWNPDLGPPFGIMYCVHCECVPVSHSQILTSCYSFYRWWVSSQDTPDSNFIKHETHDATFKHLRF